MAGAPSHLRLVGVKKWTTLYTIFKPFRSQKGLSNIFSPRSVAVYAMTLKINMLPYLARLLASSSHLLLLVFILILRARNLLVIAVDRGCKWVD